MRKDFSLMKEMSVYTHVGPTERHQQLTGFLHDIQQREEGRQELNKWQINLDQGLVQLTGRTMESESIIYKDVRRHRVINLIDNFLPTFSANNSLQSIGGRLVT